MSWFKEKELKNSEFIEETHNIKLSNYLTYISNEYNTYIWKSIGETSDLFYFRIVNYPQYGYKIEILDNLENIEKELKNNFIL